MTHGNEKKPHQPPDFSGPPEIPASTRDFLQNLLQQQRDSVLWTVHPVGGGSLAQRLADNGSIAVHVHAVVSSDSSAGWSPIVYDGKLTRRATVDGAVEFELSFDQPPKEFFHPYALCPVRMAIWPFEPVSLGGLPEMLAQPAVESIGPSSSERLGALAAASDLSESIIAANERLDVQWRDGQLDVRLAVPPRHRGQPVVVETQVRDPRGETRSSRRLISLETPVTEGEFAGYITTSIHCGEPHHIAFDQWRITVRPLRTDDLPWLCPDQVDSFLAGQRLTVLKTLAEGVPLRAAAVWADQRAAIADPQAAWLLRVATGKGVR